jgi:hypothetical protein
MTNNANVRASRKSNVSRIASIGQKKGGFRWWQAALALAVAAPFLWMALR